jgi:mono/diheme cytochrome c family protein
MSDRSRRLATAWLAPLAALLFFTILASVQAQAPAQPPATARTLQDGVYTEAQSARGQDLYTKQCAGCHGPSLAGAQGPALVGEPFVGKWRAEPISALLTKIRFTMPPETTVPLTDERTVDIVAHILKSNGFPAGATELAPTEVLKSAIGWPGARPPGSTRVTAPAPIGNLAQLMRGIFFPSSNLIFTVQTRDPGAPAPPPAPATPGSFSVFEWGQGIYTGWPVIENAAVSIADASLLMLASGLRCENGRLAPVSEPDWIRFTENTIAVAARINRLAQARNQEAVSEATGDLSDACAACHQVYRDVGGRGRGAAPGGGAANAARCTHR